MQPEQKFAAMETQVEMNLGRKLDEMEQNDLDLWMKGRALANIVPTEGWEIAVETLRTIKDDAINQLLYSVKPGETDRVLAAHAVAWGQVQMFEEFQRAIEAAITAPYPEFAQDTTPEL